MTPKGKHQR